MHFKLLLILYLSLSVIAKSDNFCRVLALGNLNFLDLYVIWLNWLEGGGDRGAYHAGAFNQFVEKLDPKEVA